LRGSNFDLGEMVAEMLGDFKVRENLNKITLL